MWNPRLLGNFIIIVAVRLWITTVFFKKCKNKPKKMYKIQFLFISLLGYERIRHSLWLYHLLYFALLYKFSGYQKVDAKSAFSKTTSVTQRPTNHGNRYSDHLNPGTVSHLGVLWKLMFSAVSLAAFMWLVFCCICTTFPQSAQFSFVHFVVI